MELPELLTEDQEAALDDLPYDKRASKTENYKKLYATLFKDDDGIKEVIKELNPGNFHKDM